MQHLLPGYALKFTEACRNTSIAWKGTGTKIRDIIKKKVLRESLELWLHQGAETNKGFQIINLSFSGGSQALPEASFLLKPGYQNIGWVQRLEGNFLLSHSHKIIVCAIQVLIGATCCSFNCLSCRATGVRELSVTAMPCKTMFTIKKKMSHSLSCVSASHQQSIYICLVCMHLCACMCVHGASCRRHSQIVYSSIDSF